MFDNSSHYLTKQNEIGKCFKILKFVSAWISHMNILSKQSQIGANVIDIVVGALLNHININAFKSNKNGKIEYCNNGFLVALRFL